MQPYIIHVCLHGNGRADGKTVRYAVLAENAAEALKAVRNGLAFGNRASMSDETLTQDQTADLALIPGKPRMIG